jgi:PIN domain nuclease of toxin-antitoxin system
LLDTHIWLWSLTTPERLAPRVRNALVDSDNELWLSPLSVWEVLWLAAKNRIEIDGDPAAWASTAVAASPVHEAPLTFEIVVDSRQVVLPHRDPVDRFLAATARVLGLRLVTADERLVAAPGLDVLANRA